ncbi:MAG TPA: SprT family zinc-dependent metalloprotease [Polyangiaceae bacterium]|jgi:predicted metal-dependent hydrolase|nr:SprT family zinc-dependent metalloprotease [Polyangiaceae bacterium]
MMSLTLGDLRFEVRRSDRRTTLGLTVERDGSLILSAPAEVADTRLEKFAREKRFWVYQKLAAKEALPPPLPARRYVNGEAFPYLGRSHRLLLVAQQDVPVKLEAGRFRMRRDEVSRGRHAMVEWYVTHARPWLAARVSRFAARVRVAPSGVAVQDLGFRWGSCGKGARLYFHWQSILLPPRIVDYVVVHELVHLREPHHTPAFWRAVERAVPDWEERRGWLADHGRQFAI